MRHWGLILESDEKLRRLERRWKETGAHEDFAAYHQSVSRHHGNKAGDELLGREAGRHVQAWQGHHERAVKAARAIRNAPRDASSDYYDEHRHHLRQAHQDAQKARDQATGLISRVKQTSAGEARDLAARHLTREHAGKDPDRFVTHVVDWHRDKVQNPQLHYGSNNRGETPDDHYYHVHSWDAANGIRKSLTHHKAGHVFQHNLLPQGRDDRGRRPDKPLHLMSITPNVNPDSHMWPSGGHSSPEWW